MILGIFNWQILKFRHYFDHRDITVMHVKFKQFSIITGIWKGKGCILKVVFDRRNV